MGAVLWREWRRRDAEGESPPCEKGEDAIVQQDSQPIVYEALLTQSESLAEVRAMRQRIEQLGGALRVERAGSAILVTLTLPPQYTPEQFFPRAPFFPV